MKDEKSNFEQADELQKQEEMQEAEKLQELEETHKSEEWQVPEELQETAMISFKGELSAECKAVIKRRAAHSIALVLAIVMSIFVAIIVLMAVLWDPIVLAFLVGLAIISVAIYAIFMGVTPSALQVDIENGHIYGIELKNGKPIELNRGGFSTDVADISEVVDYGSYYILEKIGKSSWLICQKDLLVQGTIEEFEEIFADKLVRKCEGDNQSTNDDTTSKN